MSKSLLYAKQVDITDKISIYIPTVGEVIDNQDEYFGLVSLITATPFDMMVQLDDWGIDFTTIDDFELFSILFNEIKTKDTHLLFGELNLSKFEFAVSKENGNILFRDEENDISIDKAVHLKIGRALREINFFESKHNKRPANEEAKLYLLERNRIKQQRSLKKNKKSQLEEMIIAMVNTSEYAYDFETTRGLSIYQFYSSVRQIVKKINFDNTMIGCYAGTVSAKDLRPDQLDWLTNK